MSVAERLAEVRRRVAEAARSSGRRPEEVTIVAVCKRQPFERIWEAYEAGQREFGESTAQELREVSEAALQRGYACRWHFVGRLQSNKVRVVVPRVEWVHSLDRPSLLEALAHRSKGRSLDVLIQVNLGREPQKGGVLPEALDAFAASVVAARGVVLRGLMTVPPAGEDPEPYFVELRSLRDRLRRRFTGAPIAHLSMGMSQDYEKAVRCGATMVRVGTAIFGPRGSTASAAKEV